MAKKDLHDKHESEKVNLYVESWQWETASSRFKGKHWFAVAILLSVAILFAFGFLIIAGVLLIVGVIFNLTLYILKKLS